MDKVSRPGVQESPTRFYELDAVERIVAYQPIPEPRALFALLYGTGIEVSVALALTRADVWEGTKEIRAAGTKADTRDRVCRVADWAWAMVGDHSRTVFPGVRLWPAEWNRWTVSDWHRETVGWDEERRLGLNLPTRYPLHCARDHWAVRAARSSDQLMNTFIA
jgi:integrase